MVASQPQPTPRDLDEVIAEVIRALQSIEYGSIKLVVHQGRVVGIETSKKVRLGEG